MIALNFFSPNRGNQKFKYDALDTIWMDAKTIISICSLAYDAPTDI